MGLQGRDDVAAHLTHNLVGRFGVVALACRQCDRVEQLVGVEEPVKDGPALRPGQVVVFNVVERRSLSSLQVGGRAGRSVCRDS